MYVSWLILYDAIIKKSVLLLWIISYLNLQNEMSIWLIRMNNRIIYRALEYLSEIFFFSSFSITKPEKTRWIRYRLDAAVFVQLYAIRCGISRRLEWRRNLSNLNWLATGSICNAELNYYFHWYIFWSTSKRRISLRSTRPWSTLIRFKGAIDQDLLQWLPHELHVYIFLLT